MSHSVIELYSEFLRDSLAHRSSFSSTCEYLNRSFSAARHVKSQISAEYRVTFEPPHCFHRLLLQQEKLSLFLGQDGLSEVHITYLGEG